MIDDLKCGDVDSFEQNWKEREETNYVHWTPSKAKNQIQLAFKNHWHLLCELMESRYFNNGKRVLEVGCGRGSLSCYFSDAGYDCSLLDISEDVIKKAKAIFQENELKAKFRVGSVEALPFENNIFDVVFSIGLLEHFEDAELAISEQIRLLDEGGLLFCYIVPEYSDNIQKDYEWVNEVLKGYVESPTGHSSQKKEVFRSIAGSEYYLSLLKKNGLNNISASGVYPLPMISHSIEFPFTLMPDKSEQALVQQFKKMLEKRQKKTRKNPWLCEEGYGQAFVVWGYK